MRNKKDQFSEDALNIKISNSKKTTPKGGEFKARLPLLEVIGVSFYMGWIFLLYWGGPLLPATIFSDDQAHLLRIGMIAVVAFTYLLTGVFAKPLASAKGHIALIVSVLLLAPANCYLFLGIEIAPFLAALVCWLLTGIASAMMLTLWSKHLVLFNRKQLILITASSFAVAGLFFLTISYLQLIPVVVATAALPVTLIMTTGARQWASFHSEHRQIPHLRALHPNPEFEIHPDTAAPLGIRSGDWCIIETHLSKVRMVANVTPIIDPRVVALDHAWWFPEKSAEDVDGSGCYGTYESNCNVLIEAGCGESGFGNNCKSTMCKVYREVEEVA